MSAFKIVPKRPTLTALAAVVATALGAASVAQQQDSPRENANRPPAAQSQQPGQSTQVARSDTGMQSLEQHLQNRPMRVSKLVGMELQNRGGDNLGEVRDILGSAAPGHDLQLVVSTGGIGADSKLVAIPFDQIQINADGDELYTTRTADQLASSPAVTLDSSRASPGAAGEARTAPQGAASAGARRIGDLVGAEVVGSDGDQVGEVDDLVISTAGTDNVRAVLQVGGLAGIGEKRISLPLSQLNVERTGDDNAPTIRVAMDGEALQRMPEFEYEEETTAL